MKDFPQDLTYASPYPKDVTVNPGVKTCSNSLISRPFVISLFLSSHWFIDKGTGI
jgi:hypothetical protein